MLFLTCAVLGPLSAASALSNVEKVNFIKDIQPIFQGSCIECHGPIKQKGKLRLDQKTAVFQETSVVVAGYPSKSELYRRITLPPDHDDFMPAKGDPLTQKQTDLIRDWIDQGAPWPDDLAVPPAAAPGPGTEMHPPVKPSQAEEETIAQLRELGVHVRPVARNVTWTQVNLRGIDPHSLAKAMPLLARIVTLQELNLAETPLQNEHLKHIAGLTNLTRLHLEKTPLTDAGLVHLTALSNLHYLNLHNTQISDLGLVHLQGLTRLKNLFLWQTQVSDKGAEQLRTALASTDINRGWDTIPANRTENPQEQADTKNDK